MSSEASWRHLLTNICWTYSMPPRQGIPLRCRQCGWRTTRRLEKANTRPCPKCGGSFGADVPAGEETQIVALVIGALILMAVLGVMFTMMGL